MSVEIQEVRAYAKSFFGDVDPSHDWDHVERVYKLGRRIAREENANRRVVKLSVLLHDIGRAKEDRGEIEEHATWGAQKAEEFLRDRGEDPDIVEAVKHCIESHRYSNDIEPHTIEAKAVCDADNLDALGAIGIARCFCYGGERGIAIGSSVGTEGGENEKKRESQVDHLRSKILNLKDRMYTETGEEIAQDRHDFVEDFVERFEREVEGVK
ncbi:MAG: HD domain-containing protein [Halobacteria archaeon]|nr:HD domain-containing protein [Halobacteria archaeon]